MLEIKEKNYKNVYLEIQLDKQNRFIASNKVCKIILRCASIHFCTDLCMGCVFGKPSQRN